MPSHAYIVAAYWFTALTSFVNRADTLALSASDTFTETYFLDALGFIVAQPLGVGAATLLFHLLVPSLPTEW